MSWQNAVLTWALRRWVKPNSLRALDVAASRKLTERVPFRAKLAPGWRVRTEHGSALRGEWIEPETPGHTAQPPSIPDATQPPSIPHTAQPRSDPPAAQPPSTPPAAQPRCILYFHGGAYIAMSARRYRSITSRLAIWSDARLFALDYRLAPEHPFPAALDDAVAAYRALIAAGTPPARIMVAGDSAGGGLALALLLALRDAREPLPAGALLFSPWTDLAATGASLVDNNHIDAMFFGSWVRQAAAHYLADTPATNPLVSPVYADLTGLPPMLVQVSDSEVLLDDSRRVIEHARQAGVQAKLRIWPGLPHVWQFFATILPEGRAALREAAAFVRVTLP